MNLELAAAFCRQFEGYRAKPYLCPAGVATIGYGSTYYSDGRKVTLEDAPMDEPTARALLMTELEHNYLQPMSANATPSLTLFITLGSADSKPPPSSARSARRTGRVPRSS